MYIHISQVEKLNELKKKIADDIENNFFETIFNPTPTMSYEQAIEHVLKGGFVRRPRMLQFDYYIRMEGDFIVKSTNEGYATNIYEPTDDDKKANDWHKIK